MGFGFGDAVIEELLKNKDLLPDTSQSRKNVLLYAKGGEGRDMAVKAQALAAATALREAGVTVDVVLEDKKPKWVFSRDKMGMGCVVICSADSDGEVGSGGGR